MSSRSIVVVPTYNESENIEKLLDEVLSLAIQTDVLVVDDSSPDGTPDVVKAYSRDKDRSNGRVHLLERPGKLGLGSAYRDGFRFCLENGYEHIFQMDADFSHNPKDLVRLYEAARPGKLALGARYISGGGTVGWPISRQLLSRGANIYARWMIGLQVHDLTGGFKCWPREILEKIDVGSTTSQGYAFQIETTARAIWSGFGFCEVPIVFREREQGSSKLSGNVVSEAVSVVMALARRRLKKGKRF